MPNLTVESLYQLAVQGNDDMERLAVDVHTAFVTADIDENDVVYLDPPPPRPTIWTEWNNFIADDGERGVLRLEKTLYGLRQSGRAFQ